jgi:hypothetical protein
MPVFWTRLANCHKKEATFVLTEALSNRADSLESCGTAPIVTPNLVEMIYSLRFGSLDIDDLTSGLSPFCIITAGQQDLAADARKRSNVYSMVQAGHAAPTLSQLSELVPFGAHMSETLLAQENQYRAYSVLLDVLLGPDHRVAAEVRRMVLRYRNLQDQVQSAFPDPKLVLPLLLRHTQLTMMQYFNTAYALGSTTPLPGVWEVIDIISMRRWQSLPALPSRYTPSLDGGSMGQSPAVTTLPRQPPTGIQGKGTGGGPPSVPAPNAHPDAGITMRFERWGRPLNMLTSRAGVKAPQADAGQPGADLCLSFHLRKACNSTCRRSATHRKLTTEEVSRLALYLTDANVE